MISKSPKVYTGEDVFDKVLEDIVHLLLEPGMLISENKMGRDFQVSRSVIRSAFGRRNCLNRKYLHRKGEVIQNLCDCIGSFIERLWKRPRDNG